MSQPCALGLDLGTSALKAVLVAADGSMLARASRSYGVESPHQGWAETDPVTWDEAAHGAVADLLAAAPEADVVGIGVDGQMHGVVLMDEQSDPVRPAVLWPDSRAVSELPQWGALGSARLAALANPLAPGMAGPILAWLATHEAESLARARRFVAPKDWLRSRLVTGSSLTDPSDASATLLWSTVLDDWDRELCASVGVDPRLLPALVPSGAVAGVLGANAATWGLTEEVPVGVGCGDVAATILGASLRPDHHTVIVGTGAQVVLPGSPPVPQWPVRYHTYRQADASYFAMAAVMGAGLALARVVAMLGSSWDEVYRPYDLARTLPGFLPYVSGERLPNAVPPSSAGWFEVGVGTERADLLAASLEGVVFAIRYAMEALPRTGDDIVDLTGGGGRSPVLAQLLADVLGRPVRPVERPDATARGAAGLGWRAAGLPEPDVAEGATALVEPTADAAAAEALAARYTRFVARTVALAEAT